MLLIDVFPLCTSIRAWRGVTWAPRLTCSPIIGWALWDVGKYGAYALSRGLTWFICYREQSWAAGDAGSLCGLCDIVEFWEEWWLFPFSFETPPKSPIAFVTWVIPGWDSCLPEQSVPRQPSPESGTQEVLVKYLSQERDRGPLYNRGETWTRTGAHALLSCLTPVTCLTSGRLRYLFFIYRACVRYLPL